MNTVGSVFARAKEQGRGALIAYVCAGDPDLRTTSLTIDALVRGGVDLIELGVPYSDPLADGPTIAAASQRAIEAGTRLPAVLQLAASAAANGAAVVLFGYFNPIVRYGVERFAAALADAKVLGAIVPDVPLEETGELRSHFDERGLALPLLVAPTTPIERARAIAAQSTGFTYLVSRLGVTGARREPDFAWIAQRAGQLRGAAAAPLAVGFGISTADHVRQACALTDGAIVGSALIDEMAGLSGEQAAGAAGRFAAALRSGSKQEGETVHRI